MNDNIYETLKISIYCSWEELMVRYQEYTRELKQGQYHANASAQELLEKYPWLDKVTDAENFVPRNSQEAEIFNNYNRYVQNSERNSRLYNKISKTLVDTQIATTYGKQAKEEYDKTHKTPYAILGMSPYIRMGDLPSVDKVKELAQKYPEKEQEIKKAFEEVTLQELGKQNRYNNAQNKKDKAKEEPAKKKHGFRNFLRKFIAPALVVLGLTPAIQALPEAATPEEPQSEPKQTEKETFKEQLKVNDATVSFNEQETVITPNDQFVMSQYRTTSFANVLNARANSQQTVTDIQTPASFVTPTATAQPTVQQDSLSKFKLKIQNDEELRKVVDESLKYVAVQEKQGVSAEEKLDFIMKVIGANNVDVALGSNINYGGIKNQVLNMVNNVVVYYAEKETGKNGLWIRFEEEKREKPIVTADFSIIDKSGKHYVATTWDGIGNTTDTEYGTTKGINSSVAYLIKESKKLRVLDTYAGNPRINEHLRTLNSIMLGLNNVDDIIVSRNDRER